MRCVVLVGCTIHEAHLAASAVFTAYEDTGTVTAVVQVQGVAVPPPLQLPYCKYYAALATACESRGLLCNAGCTQNAFPGKPPTLRWWTRRLLAVSSRCPEPALMGTANLRTCRA